MGHVTQAINTDEEDRTDGLKVKFLDPSQSKKINNLIEALDQIKNVHD